MHLSNEVDMELNMKKYDAKSPNENTENVFNTRLRAAKHCVWHPMTEKIVCERDTESERIKSS